MPPATRYHPAVSGLYVSRRPSTLLRRVRIWALSVGLTVRVRDVELREMAIQVLAAHVVVRAVNAALEL